MPLASWLKFAARQLWYDRAEVDRLLGRNWTERLGLLVGQAETGSAGEVRLCIEAALPGTDVMRARRLGVEQVVGDRALSLFSQLRIWDTERNSGVLLYVLVSERALEIVADRGLRAIEAQAWKQVALGTTERLRAGQREQALAWALEESRRLLKQTGLAEGGAGNELDDRPVVQ